MSSATSTAPIAGQVVPRHPHYIVLLFLFIGVLFVAIFAWFAILFTGRYPPFRLRP